MHALQGDPGFEEGNPRAWVLTIVRNTSQSWLTKNRPQALVPTGDLDEQAQRQMQQSAESAEVPTPETALIRRPRPKA